MTTTTVPTVPTAPASSRPSTARSARHLRQLRTLLGLDAGLCAVLGVAGLASATTIADDLGLATATPLVLLSALLLPYAVGLALLARSPERVARIGGALSAGGDAAWVLATAALLAAGTLSGDGITLAVVLGLAVGALGAEKALALR